MYTRAMQAGKLNKCVLNYSREREWLRSKRSTPPQLTGEIYFNTLWQPYLFNIYVE